MDIKSQYHTLSQAQFNDYLSSLKNSPSTIRLFSSPNIDYFYYSEEEINKSLLALNKAQWEFDSLLNSFSDFGKKQLIQSFFLDEIETTNKIESIYSTKHDIFSLMENLSQKKDKKISSIINYYQLLLNHPHLQVSSLNDIKKIYDALIKDSLEKKDLPDGIYFRKSKVFLSNGIKSIHEGFYPEENINQGMKDFVLLYNQNDETYLNGILTHFMLEIIHPYYDGNGRLGRFLFSSLLYQNNKTYSAFLLSQSINLNRDLYYSALKKANDLHEFGCVNNYVKDISDILFEGLEKAISSLKQKQTLIQSFVAPRNYTKSEQKIYSFLKEATVLSYFGVNNEEILTYCSISKRTLIYALNHFKKDGILKTTSLGRFDYHRLED